MPITYGISEEDKLQLDIPKSVYTGWGRDPNDFIRLLVYSEDGSTLHADERLRPEDVSFSNDMTIDIDIGTHLRNINSAFNQGTYSVQYLFLRRLAGQDQSVLINEMYNVNDGMPPEVNLLNEECLKHREALNHRYYKYQPIFSKNDVIVYQLRVTNYTQNDLFNFHSLNTYFYLSNLDLNS